ncbi:MAG TPA: succinylglutamate desuccinylase/aspartoacylase family protein [Patescibacteria group bacterium]|nr:succinylglutamate desuccinylase/aspartoacylase family protein [Patescibacteria group bacterium]
MSSTRSARKSGRLTRMGFDPFAVKSGEKAFGYVDVIDNLAVSARMPVGVVNGVEDGPTLAVTGGLYPTEYCGVEAASRLYQYVKPEALRGRFITVPVVNMPVFQFRTAWLNLRSSTTPMDGGNINSRFPGDPKGRLTSVIAHKLFSIISKANYHVDFRGGDLPESHLVHTIYLRIGDEKMDETCETMAKAFGLMYVLPGTPEIGHTSKGTLIHELVTGGVASIISEAGLGYRTQPLEELIMDHVDGTINLLRHFDMMDGELKKPGSQNYLDMEWQGVSAPMAGIFQAKADYGDILREGQIIGKISDLDGSSLAEIVSPINGVVHTLYVRRLVYPGDRLYTLLKVDKPTGWV